MSDPLEVQPMDSSKRNSPVSGPVEDEATVMLDGGNNKCHWNDQEYDDGQVVVSEGARYECSYGQWIKED